MKVLYLSYFHLSVKNPMYTRQAYLRLIAFVILLSIKKSSGSHKEVLYHFQTIGLSSCIIIAELFYCCEFVFENVL